MDEFDLYRHTLFSDVVNFGENMGNVDDVSPGSLFHS